MTRLRTTGRMLAALACAVLAGPTLPTVAAAASDGPRPADVVVVHRQVASFTDGKCNSGDTSSVTVVVDFQQLGGGTIVRCGHGLGPGARGSAALAAAGITYAGTARYGAAFVCRILGRPGPTETMHLNNGDYREPCSDTPPANAYWSYWQANEGGGWEYSQLGVLSQKARLGGFEGWSFSMNATASTNPTPRIDTSLPAPAPPSTTSAPTTSAPATTAPTTSRTTPRTTTRRATTQRPTTQRTTTQRVTSTDRPPTTGPPTTRPPTTAPTATAPTAPPTGTTAVPPISSGAISDTHPADTGPGTTSTTDSGRPVGTPGNSSTAATATSDITGSAPTSIGGPAASARTSGTAPGRTAASTVVRIPGSPDGSDAGSDPLGGSAAAPGTAASTVTGVESAGAGGAVADHQAAVAVSDGSGSVWPVIAVLALAVAAGATAFVLARRRRDGLE